MTNKQQTLIKDYALEFCTRNFMKSEEAWKNIEQIVVKLVEQGKLTWEDLLQDKPTEEQIGLIVFGMATDK